MDMRVDFELLEADKLFLNEYGLPWEAINDGSSWILIHNFPTGSGYNHSHVTAAVRMETGYPNAQLDMVYFYPPLARVDGVAINATQVTQEIDGKGYQRWSRHRTCQNPWRPGVDNLESHVTLVEDWLEREFE
ncbi:MAG TPA: hypothetical protein DCS48_12705 [Desulfovibrio sp.]|nr:hypothetical protein [Desulfovibrio sp.]